jgi:hypothetical protein
MTTHQAREAARICADREERYSELSWRDQELREENARRAATARH